MTTLEQVVEYLESKPRDWQSIVRAFQSVGGALPAPIVFDRPQGTPYLVAGNSRLMISKRY